MSSSLRCFFAGQVEVMVHRRVMARDMAYDITLNDTSVVRPSFYLLLDSPAATTKAIKYPSHLNSTPPWRIPLTNLYRAGVA